MSKIAVANASGKFEQREAPQRRPEARSAEPDSTYERPWYETPAPDEVHWSVKPIGYKPPVDSAPLAESAPIVDPELTVDRSPRAQASATLELMRLDYENAKSEFESGSYAAVIARRPGVDERFMR